MDSREFEFITVLEVKSAFDILDFWNKNFDAVLLFLLIIANNNVCERSWENLNSEMIISMILSQNCDGFARLGCRDA